MVRTRNNNTTLSLLAQLLALSSASSCTNTTSHDVHCGPGCWNPDNLFRNKGEEPLHCVVVTAGFYSPAGTNERMECDYGHYSSDQAEECTICPTGTMVLPDHSGCMDCPVGSYQDWEGQEFCHLCFTTKYKGEGSNAVTVNGDCLYLSDKMPDQQEETLEKKPTCVNTPFTCAAGCWNDDEILLDGGDRLCVPVEPGYYSPSDSNKRFPCPDGHVSSEYQASSCIMCEPGSIAIPDHTGCMPCPRGTYQDLEGGSICKSCKTSVYGGSGANHISADGQCVFKRKMSTGKKRIS